MLSRITLLILIFLSFNFCSAQNLTLDQVINLRTKPLSYIDEYLMTKRWVMISADEPTETKMVSISFAYNKSNYDDKAESFLEFSYSSISTEKNFISIQVNKISNYNLYIGRIKSLGYKLQKSFVEDGDLIKIYQTANTTIRVRTSTQKDDFASTKTSYSFFIINTNIYKSVYD